MLKVVSTKTQTQGRFLDLSLLLQPDADRNHEESVIRSQVMSHLQHLLEDTGVTAGPETQSHPSHGGDISPGPLLSSGHVHDL